MKARSLRRYLAEAFKSILRNKVMSLTSVVIVGACLFIVTFMMCVALNLDSFLSYMESDVIVNVFIDNALDADGMNALRVAIRDHEHVIGIEYIDRNQNWSRFAEKYGLDPGILQDYNPLRRYYEVTIDNGANVLSVVEWLETPEMTTLGAASINHAAGDIEAIVSLNRAVRAICLVIIAVLGVLAVIIIINTVRLTIDNRKNEIGIMKYIGSTNGFIRGPFIFEGMLLGLVGSIWPNILFIVFYDGAISYILNNFLSYVSSVSFIPGNQLFPVLVPVTLLLGALIGTLSSLFTIRKYLNV